MTEDTLVDLAAHGPSGKGTLRTMTLYSALSQVERYAEVDQEGVFRFILIDGAPMLNSAFYRFKSEMFANGA